MRRACVVAGSFDPVTRGHLHVIETATGLFDDVVVAVLNSSAKRYMFTEAQRLELLQVACAGITARNVRTLTWDGLLVDLLNELHIDYVVRGIRDARDTDAERQIALVNAVLRPGTTTVWVGSGPQDWAVSSTVVRELIQFGADLGRFVPNEVAERILFMRAAKAN